MEVDTGASLSLMSHTTTGLWPGRSLESTSVRLQTYFNAPIPVVGRNIEYNGEIYVDPNSEPRIIPARSVPYALRDLVDKELTHLQKDGTLKLVEISEWAAPIGVGLHDKKSVRICLVFHNPLSQIMAPVL